MRRPTSRRSASGVISYGGLPRSLAERRFGSSFQRQQPNVECILIVLAGLIRPQSGPSPLTGAGFPCLTRFERVRLQERQRRCGAAVSLPACRVTRPGYRQCSRLVDRRRQQHD